MSLPLFKTITFWEYSKTISISWVTTITVFPVLWYAAMSSKISFLPLGSSPAVGSSRIKMSGSLAIIPAIATRLFSPPESSNGDLSKYDSGIPTSLSALIALSFASSSLKPKFLGPNITSFKTVSLKSWYSGNWKTIPTFFFNLEYLLFSFLTVLSLFFNNSFLSFLSSVM